MLFTINFCIKKIPFMLLKQDNCRKVLVQTFRGITIQFEKILLYHKWKTNVFFSNCWWESSILLDSFDHASESATQCGNGKVLESATFEIRNSIMAPKCRMSTNLPGYVPKWTLSNYGLGSRNDEVGFVKSN